MDRQELLYRGAVLFDGDESPTGGVELWVKGRTVMAFIGTTSRLVLHHVTLTRDGDTTIVTGDEGTVIAVQPPQAQSAWIGKILRYPDGSERAGATVESSTLGVRIAAAGHPTEFLAGARTYVIGARKYVAPFGGEPSDEIDVTDPAGSCGPCSAN